MPELNSELREIYLQPGELHIAREPAIIRKALGACIGITFWSVGALAHPLLPNCPTDLTAEKCLVTGPRYVDFSIRHGGNLGRQLQFPHRDRRGGAALAWENQSRGRC